MANSEEESKNFKVVDKRRFTESGESQSKSENQEVTGEKKSADEHGSSDGQVLGTFQETKPQNQTPAPNPSDNETSDESEGGIDFASFLVGVYSQTLIFLGEIPSPDTNLVSKNLEAARQNIDILSILEEKTMGNLTQEEQGLMTEILNNLRLLFVKKL